MQYTTASLQQITPATTPAVPATSGKSVLERIELLDILRGIALVGMFMVHFNYYEATPLGAEPGRLASFIDNFIGLFIEERFWGMFGMLFGVGFAVQLTRAEARGEPFVGRYLRRLAGLAVFGFIAEGVFGYNVLMGYAIWGLPLLLVRRFSVRALVVLLVLCAASWQIRSITRLAIYNTRRNGMEQLRAEGQANRAAWMAAVDTLRTAERSGSWSAAIAARIRHIPKFHKQWSMLPQADFVLFLFGLIAFRLGLFHRPEKHRRLIGSLMLFGVGATALALWGLPLGGPVPPAPPPGMWDRIVLIARTSGFSLFRPQWLMFTYVGAVLLLVSYNRAAWLGRLSAFGWAGRMALTNYMMQVVLVEVMFTTRGLGMKVPALLVLPAAIGLFVAQVFMSRWWLSRFRLGPLEWVWRSITYWKVQPFRIERPRPIPVLATEVV